MPSLMKAANMVCGVLRNNEKLAAAARLAASGNGAAAVPGQYNQGRPGGAPPPQVQAPGLAPAPYQFQQQAPLVRVDDCGIYVGQNTSMLAKYLL